MGLFNKNNNDEELLVILGEIRDNIKIKDKEHFEKQINHLEGKIIDIKTDCRVTMEDNIELTKKVDRLEEIVELQAKQTAKITEVFNLQLEHIKNNNNEIFDLKQQISELTPNMEVVEEVKTEPKKEKQKTRQKKQVLEANPNTIRKNKCYGNINHQNIGDLTKDGKIKRKNTTKNGKYFQFNINDLLLIKSLIPCVDEYPSISSITKKVGKFSATTINDLVHLIENGYFDRHFKEWEQIQADKTYKNGWKPVIENNPEKRKEMGIYG